MGLGWFGDVKVRFQACWMVLPLSPHLVTQLPEEGVHLNSRKADRVSEPRNLRATDKEAGFCGVTVVLSLLEGIAYFILSQYSPHRRLSAPCKYPFIHPMIPTSPRNHFNNKCCRAVQYPTAYFFIQGSPVSLDSGRAAGSAV